MLISSRMIAQMIHAKHDTYTFPYSLLPNPSVQRARSSYVINCQEFDRCASDSNTTRPSCRPSEILFYLRQMWRNPG